MESLQEKSALEEPNMDTSKSVPLGLFNISAYIQLIVYVHHKMEVLA